MKDARNVLRIVGMIFLGVFVFVVVAPLVLKVIFGVVGIATGIIALLIGLAVLLINVAVVLAIGYLVLVGIRALVRQFFMGQGVAVSSRFITVTFPSFFTIQC